MATIPISLTIAGDTVSAVSVVSLTRSDTGADAGIALPIALTLTSGAWVGSFTDASPPPYYTVILSVTYSDSSVQTMPAFTLGSGATVAGIYGTISDIVAEMGAFNEQQAASPDNDGNATQTALHEQKAISFADSYINAKLSKANFATPATVNLDYLRTIFGKLGAYQLYQVRGLQDETNAFQAKFDWAKEELEELIFLNRGGFTYNAGVSTGIDAVAQTVNPDGTPFIGTPPFPVSRWNGFYWTMG